MPRYRLPFLVLPIAALIAILPLILQGCSCGHDFDFHILNWLEAAHQFQHGNLHPHWAFTSAWNAGEPRFVFYPPISWTIGAILGLILPWTWTPIAYIWLALTAAGLSLYYLAKTFTTPQAALLVATFYIVNPYMLFTAYERTAYAELLAAAWIPLLLHAILREKVTIPRIAIPIALLWLTNAPAAVMGCYTLALLALIRIATNPSTLSSSRPLPDAPSLRTTRNPGAPSFAPFAKGGISPGAPSSSRSLRLRWASRESATAPAHLPNGNTTDTLHLALRTTIGTALGLSLAAFYILPAAYERRYVQIAMAILPGLGPSENFLFHHTTDVEHDIVLYTASTIAIIFIALTAMALLLNRFNRHKATHPTLNQTLTILALTIAFFLTPPSAPIWHLLPEVRFLQFPWRLLAILAPALSLALALALAPLKLRPLATAAISVAIAALFTYPAYRVFHQRCYPEDTVPSIVTIFHSHQGYDPTDEYTPTTAKNEVLTEANPPFWLSSNPKTPAPTSTNPGPAPSHLTLDSPTPQILILNLRDYPAWKITNNNTVITPRLKREDGLIAIPLPAGSSNLAITYTQTTDQTIGYLITAIALVTLSYTRFRRSF
jgi:hypothetical protein